MSVPEQAWTPSDRPERLVTVSGMTETSSMGNTLERPFSPVDGLTGSLGDSPLQAVAQLQLADSQQLTASQPGLGSLTEATAPAMVPGDSGQTATGAALQMAGAALKMSGGGQPAQSAALAAEPPSRTGDEEPAFLVDRSPGQLVISLLSGVLLSGRFEIRAPLGGPILMYLSQGSYSLLNSICQSYFIFLPMQIFKKKSLNKHSV